MERKTILFFHQGRSSFVEEDLRILSNSFRVREFYFSTQRSGPKIITAFQYLLQFIRQFLWLLINIRSGDFLFAWFSDFHSFLPAVFSSFFNKPLLVVNGGYDAVNNKELGYGIFRDTWQKRFGIYVLRHARLLLPVDQTLIRAEPAAEYWGEAYPNGILHHIPDLDTEWTELPTGYNPSAWPAGPAERKAEVLTVAFIDTIRTAKIKGIDLYIECARSLPEFTFRIIGVPEEMQGTLGKAYHLPQNIFMYPPVKRDELSEFYRQASVYAQLSRSEGLPNVLCEAMLSGCIPVGSPVYGIPKAISNTGFIAEKPDTALIASLIKKAHQQQSVDSRKKVRDRIIDEYSLKKRENTLTSILNNL
ncbi:glycosyltransferase family 4 protein [Balneola sp. MJW-20]|uniref:glycosyltransferase family 4 protein n=1 Tax=Gracilimonas aurantiaca TaxID=3234185 RepID=UPI00346670D0